MPRTGAVRLLLRTYNRKKFGISSEFRIGMHAQPDIDTVVIIINNVIRIVMLSPFLDFEDSPINFYNMAQN